MSKKGDGCECCGRPGTRVEAGDQARMRCVRHAYVVDAGDWLRARSATKNAFESEDELMSYLRQDYGAGVEMMQELQAAASKDSSDADETLH